jgi:peptidoglycan/xylan/chitin deacetylase (PgdA/CDA1 family)
MKQGRIVPVLMHHHVSPTAGMITVSTDNFEDQLKWMRDRGYHSLTCDAFAAHLNGEPVPERSVLITFDDGYLDNWVYAYPLMKRYGFKGVIFVVTSWLGDGPPRPHLGQGELPETPDHRECEARIAQGRADEVMLRWSEVDAMRADGVFEFHSHTHTHTRWDRQCAQRADKVAGITADIAQAREILTTRLGGPSAHLCWPQGYFDDDYVKAARDAGYTHLYTTDPKGRNRPGGNPGHIHRITAKDAPGAWLRRRMTLARHPILAPLYDKIRY